MSLKMKKVFPFLLLITIFLSACNLPNIPGLGQKSSNGNYWITLNNNGPATPTPFLPVGEDLSSEQLPTSESENNPAPTLPVQKRPEGQVNILILGSDWRPTGGYRTDVFMLLSLYPNQGTASIISFPRDLYVNLPGIGNQRINVAQAYGGFDLTNAMLEENFNVTADHYIMTNFDGFKNIINSLGGIDVNVGITLSDHCELPQGGPSKTCTVYPGINYMNGETALWYVRSRYSTSDLDRTRRAQEVMLALFSKMMSLDAVSRAPELYNLYSNTVETDMTIGDIIPMVPLASELINDTSKMRRYAIGINEVTPTVLPASGAQVLLPNYDAIQSLINQSAFTP
jgi:LCP family protein required for cell wall assembly